MYAHVRPFLSAKKDSGTNKKLSNQPDIKQAKPQINKYNLKVEIYICIVVYIWQLIQLVKIVC